MPRPATEAVDPFTVPPGTFIRMPGNGPDEVVRAVSIVFEMANGAVLTFRENETVQALVEQPAPRLGKEGRRTDLAREPLREVERGAEEPSGPSAGPSEDRRETQPQAPRQPAGSD